MSSAGLAARDLAGDDLVELVHLEPVEHAALDRLDQVGRLEPGLLDGVAADEDRALEHDVVELAGAAVVGADRADERAGPQPLAAQHRVARGRDGDDHVLRGRVAVRPPPPRRRSPCRTPSGARACGTRRRRARCPARAARMASTWPRPASRSRSRRGSPPPACARYFAATPLAAPVRSRPSASASITACSSGVRASNSSDAEARRRRRRRCRPWPPRSRARDPTRP